MPKTTIITYKTPINSGNDDNPKPSAIKPNTGGIKHIARLQATIIVATID